MQTYHFFKVNLAGQGYKIVWARDTPPLDLKLEIIDNSLSHPTASGFSPNIAYSAAKLDSTHILVSVGNYWAEHHDEYGRPGLFFWHGVLCILPRIDKEQTKKISDLLIQLIQNYSSEYDRFGKIISNLATLEQNDKRWITTFTRLKQHRPPKFDENLEISIDKFVDSVNRVPTRANLKMKSPLRYEHIAPFLVCLLLYRDDVLRIAGGTLTQATPDQFQYISVPANISGYQGFDISELLQGMFENPAITSGSNQFQTEMDTLHQEKTEPKQDNQRRKYILLIIGASVIFCISAILIFNVLRPQTESPTSIPLSVTISSTPAIDIVVTSQVQPSTQPPPSFTPTLTPTATHQILEAAPSETPHTPTPEPMIPFACQGIVNPGEQYHIIVQGDTLLKIAATEYGLREMSLAQNIYNSNVERGNPSVKNFDNITAGGCLFIP